MAEEMIFVHWHLKNLTERERACMQSVRQAGMQSVRRAVRQAGSQAGGQSMCTHLRRVHYHVSVFFTVAS